MHPTKPTLILMATLLAVQAASARDEHDHERKSAASTRTVANELQAHGDEHAEHTASPDGHADRAEDHGPDEHADEVKLTEAAIRQNGVRIAPAAKMSLAASFVAPARIAFNREAMAYVGCLASGRVAEIKVKQGDHVKAGDVLLVVESQDFGRAQSEFLQRLTESEVAAAAVEPAKNAYERAQKLFEETQGIAQSEVQKREADYRAAIGLQATSRAAADAAEHALQLLGFDRAGIDRLAETKKIDPAFAVHAPIAGQIIEREVTIGEFVAPEKERLLTIADTARVWLLADIPEARLPQISVGSTATIQVAATPSERIQGEVTWVSPEVDAATRAARVRIVVENADNQLKPGMFAKAMLSPRNAAAAVLAVPEEAVQSVEGEPSVFVPVENEPNTFARRTVVVGRAVNGFLPVMTGIAEGDPVVVSGSFIFKAELAKGSAHHEH